MAIEAVGRSSCEGIRAAEAPRQRWIEETSDANDTELYIITGPIFWEDAEDDPNTADGEVTIEVIGENEVSVPTHLYKIIVQALPDRQSRAVAIVMPNQDHESPADYAAFVKPISWIEERIGVNFMPQLDLDDPELRNRLENEPGVLFDE